MSTVKSYFNCESGGRFVTVWPSVTAERGFYDVVFGDVPTENGDERDGNTTRSRLTAFEAASYVVTELGAPLATTLDAVTGMIERWRAEFDATSKDGA